MGDHTTVWLSSRRHFITNHHQSPPITTSHHQSPPITIMYTTGTLTLTFVTIFAVIVTTNGAVPPPCYMTAGQEGRHGLSGSKILTLEGTNLKECKKACLAFAGREECYGIELQQGGICHLFNTSQSRRDNGRAYYSVFSEKRCEDDWVGK